MLLWEFTKHLHHTVVLLEIQSGTKSTSAAKLDWRTEVVINTVCVQVLEALPFVDLQHRLES